MEFHEKLQELRKQRSLTQEELAEALYVSRTAISKWESGRGYPSIDSLKAISSFFSVSIDTLLSGEEVLNIAEEDQKHTAQHFRDLVFGLLDCSAALFFFLPLFGQSKNETIQDVSLLALSELQPWLKTAYVSVVAAMIAAGIVTLALQTSAHPLWLRHKTSLSLCIHTLGAFLFILSRQPYAAAFLFIFLVIKVFLILKRQ